MRKRTEGWPDKTNILKLSLHERLRLKIQNINIAKAAKNFDEDDYKVKNILVVFARIFSNLCIVFILNLSSGSLV